MKRLLLTLRIGLSLLVLLVMGMGVSVYGQAAAARPDRGMTPNGSYAVSDLEKISLTNGNLNISIPLASLPPMSGGKLGYTLKAEYNSKNWDATRKEYQQDPLDPGTRYVTTTLQVAGGWVIGGTYSITFEDSHDDFDWMQPSGNDPEYKKICLFGIRDRIAAWLAR